MRKTDYVLLAILFVYLGMANAYGQNYIDTDVCSNYETFKGKKDHGKKYCTSFLIIRKFKNGDVDTVGMYGYGRSFPQGEYDDYEKLSDRNKYLYDSLREDGHISSSNTYLQLETSYMTEQNKIVRFYRVVLGCVFVETYLLERKKGATLLFAKELK